MLKNKVFLRATSPALQQASAMQVLCSLWDSHFYRT